MTAFLTTDELAAAGERVRRAALRYRLVEVAPTDDALFDRVYRLLDTEFGGRGELERRDVVERWRKNPQSGYVLFAALSEAGEIVGLRDCHVRCDAARRVVVVHLSHVLVVPAHRRTGLAGLLRHVALVVGRRHARAPGHQLILAAEMEPHDPADPATAVRLLAYRQSGFRAVDPAACVYYQPDFRAGEGEPTTPVPLLLILRWVDREQETSMPCSLVDAAIDALYDVFATHCQPEPLRVLRAAIAARLTSREVPLLPLPSSADDPRLSALVHHGAGEPVP
jgi:hypothetical protein